MSEATKFTPGPWEAAGYFVRTPLNDGGYLIADLSANGMCATRLADAQLMAAAPELYAACATDAVTQPLLLAANVLRNKGYDELADALTHKHYREVAALKKARGA